MNNEFVLIKQFFNNHQVFLTDEWLVSCIQWCKQENLSPNYTQLDLQIKVYEQWLLLDLGDLKAACLPPNLDKQKKYMLNGNFSLQIQKIVDISKPKLWQIQKIRNSNTVAKTVKDENENGKRVLQVTLTDGVQEVEAMEYKPVPCLNLNLTPGVKVRLIGPVLIRRGRIMLEEQNVKVLGGEVEDIIVSNAAENVLARALNLQENPNPLRIDENMLTTPNEEGNTQIIVNPPKPVSAPRQTITAEAEEMRIAAEIEMLMETERDMNLANPVQSRPNHVKTPDLFDDGCDFDNLDVIDIIESNAIKANKKTAPPSSNPTIEELNSFENDDVFNDMDIDAHLDQIENASTSNHRKIITIDEFLQHRSKYNGVIKIRAKFKAIEEKLTFTENAFRLVIRIEDSTGSLGVNVHNDIISRFAGYTPQGILNLKKGIFEKDENATAKIIKAIQSVKDKLLLLDNFLEINIVGNDTPTLINIL